MSWTSKQRGCYLHSPSCFPTLLVSRLLCSTILPGHQCRRGARTVPVCNVLKHCDYQRSSHYRPYLKPQTAVKCLRISLRRRISIHCWPQSRDPVSACVCLLAFCRRHLIFMPGFAIVRSLPPFLQIYSFLIDARHTTPFEHLAWHNPSSAQVFGKLGFQKLSEHLSRNEQREPASSNRMLALCSWEWNFKSQLPAQRVAVRAFSPLNGPKLNALSPVTPNPRRRHRLRPIFEDTLAGTGPMTPVAMHLAQHDSHGAPVRTCTRRPRVDAAQALSRDAVSPARPTSWPCGASDTLCTRSYPRRVPGREPVPASTREHGRLRRVRARHAGC